MNTKILLAIVAVVAVLGGAGFVLTQNKTENDSPATSTSAESANTASSEEKEEAHHEQEKIAQTVGQQSDCSLYTLDELATIWGVPMVDIDTNLVIETSDGGKQYSCGYNETDSGLGVSFSVEIREFKSVEKAKSDMANTRDGAKLGEEVYFIHDEQDGLGDEAFFSTSKRAVDSGKNVNELLYVRHDSTVMLLSATNLDGVGADYRDKMIASFNLHLN
jgi:hypothetical protein